MKTKESDKFPCCVDCITFAMCKSYIIEKYNVYTSNPNNSPITSNDRYGKYYSFMYLRNKCSLIQDYTDTVLYKFLWYNVEKTEAITSKNNSKYITAIHNKVTNTFMKDKA